MKAEWKMKEDSLSVEDEERTGYSILSRNARSREPNDLVSEGAASVHGAPQRRQNGRGREGWGGGGGGEDARSPPFGARG